MNEQKKTREGSQAKKEGKDQKETYGFLYSFKETQNHHSPKFRINVFGQTCFCL